MSPSSDVRRRPTFWIMRVRIIRPRSNGYSPEPGLREDVIAANRDQMGGRGDAEKGLRCGFGDNLTGAPNIQENKF